MVYPLLFGFHNDDTEKSGETIATPPKRGVPTGPDSGAEWHASIRPPGGRYRRYLSLREGSETGQIGSATALRFECPLSPRQMIPDRSSPLRVRFAIRAKLVHLIGTGRTDKASTMGAKPAAAYVRRRPLQSTSHHLPAPGPHLDPGAEEMGLGVSECDLFQLPRSGHFFLQ